MKKESLVFIEDLLLEFRNMYVKESSFIVRIVLTTEARYYGDIFQLNHSRRELLVTDTPRTKINYNRANNSNNNAGCMKVRKKSAFLQELIRCRCGSCSETVRWKIDGVSILSVLGRHSSIYFSSTHDLVQLMLTRCDRGIIPENILLKICEMESREMRWAEQSSLQRKGVSIRFTISDYTDYVISVKPERLWVWSHLSSEPQGQLRLWENFEWIAKQHWWGILIIFSK